MVLSFSLSIVPVFRCYGCLFVVVFLVDFFGVVVFAVVVFDVVNFVMVAFFVALILNYMNTVINKKFPFQVRLGVR